MEEIVGTGFCFVMKNPFLQREENRGKNSPPLLRRGIKKTTTRRKSMKRTILLVVMLMLSLSVSNGLFAAEVKTEENRVYGKVVKADCDKSSVIIEVRGGDKAKKTEVTFKLTDKTQLSGFKACKEIAAGSQIAGRYVKAEEDNVLTILSAPPVGRTAGSPAVSPPGRGPAGSLVGSPANAAKGEEAEKKK